MSFRLKTVLGIAVIEAITLSLLIWTSLNFLKTSNERALMDRASTTAVMFATMTTDAVLSFDLASLESFIEELLKNPGVVYGRIISSSDGLLADGGDREVLARPFVAEFNPAAETIFGYTSREVIGNNVNLLVPEPHKKRHNDYIHSYLKTGNAKIIGIGREVDGERKNGDLFPLELGISEINIEQKRLFTGIVRDISERKQTEEELQRYRENRQRTNVNALIETALKMQLDNLKNRGIAVSKNLETDLPELLVDQNRFMQVLINIIKNACEAIDARKENDAPKRINFKTASNQDRITVEITDTGIGIAPDQIQELFEPGISKKGSTGFGLHYSKMFMENNNGQLTIESRGLGQGATLKLVFKH